MEAMIGRLIKLRRPTVLMMIIGLICLLWLCPSILLRKNHVVNLKELLITSISVAIKGGNEVYRVMQEQEIHESSKGKTKDGANDPVTNADYKSHCVMYYGIKRVFPEIKVISEENIAENLCDVQYSNSKVSSEIIDSVTLDDEFVNSEDVTVWIDPLDATQEYTEHLLDVVSTMVCIAVNGKSVIGIVHLPFENKQRTSWAWNGKAVSENLKHKSPSGNNNEKPIIIISRSHAGKVKNIINNAFDSNVEVITAGGAGYKVLQVVNNNVTAYVHSAIIKKWDICAGNAILNAVGGRMSSLSHDSDIDYSSDTDVVNTGGILATVSNHKWYFDKLSALKKAR